MLVGGRRTYDPHRHVERDDRAEQGDSMGATFKRAAAWPQRRSAVSVATTDSVVAAAIALALSTASFAQTEQGAAVEQIVVTGTRIQQTSGMDTPTPVAALSALEITEMAPGSITEALTQLPQFYASATAATFGGANNNFFTSPGGGSLNLRGVGAKRTLTLLDGRRVVSASIYGGPDINSFPEAMLKSVESVTGGASAAYGTDAVSGVINYILNTDFDGINAHVQKGRSDRGDADNDEYSIAFGTQLGERAHVLFSAEHAQQDAVATFRGRDWYKGWGMLQLGTGASRDDPRMVPAPHVVSTAASYDGVILSWNNAAGQAMNVPGLGLSTFNRDGTVSAFVLGSPVAAGNRTHSIANGGSGTDNNADRPNVLSGSKRSNGFAYFDYDLTDQLNLYVQGMVSDQELVASNGGGIFCPPTVGCQGNQAITIFANNAFLPSSLRAQMANNGIASFTLGRIGHSSDIAGGSFVRQETRMRSGTAGFNASVASDGFFDGWTIDGYYQHGETDVDAAQEGGIRIDRIWLALDAVVDPATGNIVCNASLAPNSAYRDCRPLNLFGRGNASAEAIDWVTGFDPGVRVTTTPYLPGYPPEPYSYVGDAHKHRLIAIEQQVAEVSASGKVAEGWAGPIAAAFGAHYRKESLDQKVRASQGNPSADPLNFDVVPANNPALNIRGVPAGARNNSVEIQFSKVPFARGEYDIREVFGEMLLPLFSAGRWLQQVNFNGAARWADYAGSGAIWTYKGGLDTTFTDSFRLRGTYSRDVRAANLGERFDRTGGAGSVRDPRKPASSPNVPVTFVQGGNPDVAPEEADTYTVGFVYRPAWLDGFDVSVDWLSVSLDGSIEQFASQEIVDACYIRNDQDQCANITLDAIGEFSIINQTYQNVSKAKISGIDIEMGYSRPVKIFGGDERLGLRVFASYLEENSTTNSQGVKTDRAGQVGGQIGTVFSLPEWKATVSLNYSRGPLRSFLQLRYIGDGAYDTQNGIGVNNWVVADNTIGSVAYVDLRLAWDLDIAGGTVELFGNASNLFDRAPPVIPAYGAGGAAPTQHNAGLYDVVGRRFALGVNMRF
jgi:iron complex outermembrane recepter protein